MYLLVFKKQIKLINLIEINKLTYSYIYHIYLKIKNTYL